MEVVNHQLRNRGEQMKEQRIHFKATPPLLPSFTACGLWIYVVVRHQEKKVTRVKTDVDCLRCRNTKEFKKAT